MGAVTWKAYVKHRFLFLLLFPALIYIIIFSYGPMYGVLIAFKDYSFTKGVWASPWVGFDHFTQLFNASTNFTRILRNTIVISGLKMVFTFSGAVLLALFFNEIRNKVFKRITQNISYLPHFLSWVIIGSIMLEMLSPSTGVVNKIIQLFGGQPIFFMAEKYWFIAILVASDIWQSVGWGSIVYLAAISGIDPQLYDSAKMDGAGRARQMFSITLPCIANVVAIMLILQVGSILNAGFDQIFNLYNFKVFEVADILDTYAYRAGLEQGNYSLSTAVSLFKNGIGLLLVLVANKIVNRMGHTGLW